MVWALWAQAGGGGGNTGYARDTLRSPRDACTPCAAVVQVPREPDGVTWMGTEYFATADEGDLHGGSRGFTIFSKNSDIVYSSASELDHLAARIGHYPEGSEFHTGDTHNVDRSRQLDRKPRADRREYS